MIVVAHILASESAYLLASSSKPPDYQGLGRIFIISAKPMRRIAISLAITVVLIALLFQSFWEALFYSYLYLTIVLLTFLSILYTRTKAHELLGFANGDVLGFCYELTRTAIFVSAACFTALD